VLLASTLTVAFACQAAIAHRGSHAFFWLALTCMLGIGFLGLEIRELARLVLSGAGPGHSGFLSAFFTLLGTHGMHVFAGVIWGITLLSQLVVKGTPQPVVSRLQRLTLFWHFLDIVWIGVFSIAYLPGITG
jgi:cytochrome o ubiquinol oxidase subunit 3